MGEPLVHVRVWNENYRATTILKSEGFFIDHGHTYDSRTRRPFYFADHIRVAWTACTVAEAVKNVIPWTLTNRVLRKLPMYYFHHTAIIGSCKTPITCEECAVIADAWLERLGKPRGYVSLRRMADFLHGLYTRR